MIYVAFHPIKYLIPIILLALGFYISLLLVTSINLSIAAILRNILNPTCG